MKGQRNSLPTNPSNTKARGSMSRAQMKAMVLVTIIIIANIIFNYYDEFKLINVFKAYNDKQKAKKKLARKLQLSDSGYIYRFYYFQDFLL